MTACPRVLLYLYFTPPYVLVDCLLSLGVTTMCQIINRLFDTYCCVSISRRFDVFLAIVCI